MVAAVRSVSLNDRGLLDAKRGGAGLVLGLRLIGLAAVAGVGALLLRDSWSRSWLATWILAAVLVGLAQLAADRGRLPVPAWSLILTQVGVWIALIHVSGGQRSPLAMGLVFEVPLAAGILGRRGGVLAAATGVAGFLAYATLARPPAEPEVVGLVIACLVVSAVLSAVLVGMLERKDRALAEAHAALAARADGLANELRLLGDYMTDAWIDVDELGRVASINRAGLALLGDPVTPTEGQPWQEVLRPDARTAAELARVLDKGRPLAGVDLVFHHDDGTPVMARAEVWLSPTRRGHGMHLLLARAHGAPAEDDPLRRLGEASACVAHQIRNSLQALQGLAHRAAQDADTAGPAFDGPHLEHALRSLGDLAEDVLAVAGTRPPAMEVVPLEQAVSSAVLLARPAGARVTIDAGCEELLVRAHRGSLVHALFNLLDNACRATPAPGTVRVRMARDGDSNAVVEIADQGPGLPPGVDGTNGPVTSCTGAGLGLVAARRFLESCGGGMSFAPGSEGGTVCRVRLVAVSGRPQPLLIGEG